MTHDPGESLGDAPHDKRRAFVFAWAAMLYAAFLASVVLAADSGRWQWFFELVQQVPFGDKVGHLVFLGTLSFLFSAATSRKIVRVGPLALPKAAVVIIVLAAIEECSQRFFPSRTFDLFDLTANTLGAFAGGLVALRARA